MLLTTDISGEKQIIIKPLALIYNLQGLLKALLSLQKDVLLLFAPLPFLSTSEMGQCQWRILIQRSGLAEGYTVQHRMVLPDPIPGSSFATGQCRGLEI